MRISNQFGWSPFNFVPLHILRTVHFRPFWPSISYHSLEPASIWKPVSATLSTIIESRMVWRVCLFQMYSWNFEIFIGLLFGTYVACMEFIIHFSTSNRYWASYQHTNISICLCHCFICHFFDNAFTLDGFNTNYMCLHVEKCGHSDVDDDFMLVTSWWWQ